MKSEWGAWLFCLIASCVLAWVDVLGSTPALKQVSNNIYLDAAAGSFGEADTELGISVLLIEDKDLPFLGESWPVSLETHAQILLDLSDLNPKAIIVDFIFSDDRTSRGAEALISSTIEAGAKQPVIYMNPITAFGKTRSGTLTEFFGQNNAGYNLYAADPTIYEFIGKTTVLPTIAETWVGVQAPTPALAVLDSVCANSGKYCNEASNLREQEAFQLVWPAHPKQCGMSDVSVSDKCPVVPSGFVRRLLSSFLATLLPNFRSNTEEQLQYSYPYETISATDLLNGSIDSKEIENRVVIIGGRFSGVRDVVKSPTYGTLPGVYAHAAALENILVYDGYPYRNGRPFQLNDTFFDWFYIASLVTGLFGIRAIAIKVRGGRSIWQSARFLDIAILFGLSTGLAFIEVTVFRTTPDNWLLGTSLVSFTLLGWRYNERSRSKPVP